jgi:hypothetical protein
LHTVTSQKQNSTAKQTLEHQALAKLIQKANLLNLLIINKLQKAGQDFGPRFCGQVWAEKLGQGWARSVASFALFVKYLLTLGWLWCRVSER